MTISSSTRARSAAVYTAVLLAAGPLSSCNYCTDVFEGFEWKFSDTQPDVWEAIEGGDLLGVPAVVHARCGDRDDDASCTNLTLTPSTAGNNPSFGWSIDIVAVMPNAFVSGPLDPATSLHFGPDCRLCCAMSSDGTGWFEPNDRRAMITSGTWSGSGGSSTEVRLTYDLTIEVPAVAPADLADFPNCPGMAFRFRIAGTVVGHRERVVREHCPT